MKQFEQTTVDLAPSSIEKDPRYQRPLEQSRINRIVREWNINLMNKPKVSSRAGKFWVFDGQHTIAAWKAIHGGADAPITCTVFHGMTWQDEMELFVQQNGISRGLNVTEKLFALYNGNDTDVRAMVSGAQRAGIIVDFVKQTGPFRCVALSALLAAYKALPFTVYCEMLRTIMEAWNGDSESLSAPILKGMTKVYAAYHGQFLQKDMVAALSRVTPNQIIRLGRDLGNNGTGFALAICRQYNKKRSTRRLDGNV